MEALCLRSDQEVIEHHRFTYNIPNAPIEASGRPSNKDYERPAAHEQAHALSETFWLTRCFIASSTEALYASVHTQMNMLSFARYQTNEQPSRIPASRKRVMAKPYQIFLANSLTGLGTRVCLERLACDNCWKGSESSKKFLRLGVAPAAFDAHVAAPDSNIFNTTRIVVRIMRRSSMPYHVSTQ